MLYWYNGDFVWQSIDYFLYFAHTLAITVAKKEADEYTSPIWITFPKLD